MITVLVAEDRIHVSGHANMAPKGSDIVCAAVSALTLTLKGAEGNCLHGAVRERGRREYPVIGFL